MIENYLINICIGILMIMMTGVGIGLLYCLYQLCRLLFGFTKCVDENSKSDESQFLPAPPKPTDKLKLVAEVSRDVFKKFRELAESEGHTLESKLSEMVRQSVLGEGRVMKIYSQPVMGAEMKAPGDGQGKSEKTYFIILFIDALGNKRIHQDEKNRVFGYTDCDEAENNAIKIVEHNMELVGWTIMQVSDGNFNIVAKPAYTWPKP